MNLDHAANSESAMSRRDFVARSTRAGLAVAALAAGAAALYDGRGPSGRQNQTSVSLPGFAVPGVGAKLSIMTGTDRSDTVLRAFKALGGIEQFIKPGDRVVLKVNAAFASPPSLCATSHPDLVAAVARLCLGAGASSVVVTDNPINDPACCFALTGIAKAAQSAGARLALPDTSAFKPASVPGGRLIKNWPLLFEPLRNATKLIGLAPVKDHHRSGASLSMKNWYGLLGGRRNIFHQDIHTTILELATLVQPTLVILDGTNTMIANGPTGGSLSDLKPTNTMVLSTDQVAADAFAATLLAKTPAELPFLAKAAAAGLGTADWESLKPSRG
jgi:uncharacterized protein (DUF362 family)